MRDYIMFFANDVLPSRQPVIFQATSDTGAQMTAKHLDAHSVYKLGERVATDLQKK